MKSSTFIGLLVAGLFTVSAQAALYDRGNGLIYDDVLNITWMQDANYAQTSGYEADGQMAWVASQDMGRRFKLQHLSQALYAR